MAESSPRSGRLPALPDRPRKAIEHLRAADPLLAKAIESVGRFPLPRRTPDLHLLCSSIIGQSISIKAAEKIVGRFSEAFGRGEGLDPRRLSGCRPETLRRLGLTAGKAQAIRDLAGLWLREEWDPAALSVLPDDAITSKLVAIKGIGPWTAKMFLIFGLRRPDVLPHEDLGFRAGLCQTHHLAEAPGRRAVEQITDCWSPWRTVGTVYVWQALLLHRKGDLGGPDGWWAER